MRLLALAAQLQGFVHSTDNLAVGVSPRNGLYGGGLIPPPFTDYANEAVGLKAHPSEVSTGRAPTGLLHAQLRLTRWRRSPKEQL
jgi:hypothetical protein